MDPALQQLLSEGMPNDEVEVIIKLKNSLLIPKGIRIISRFGNIVTARLLRANILPVYDSGEIFSMKAPRLFDEMDRVFEDSAKSISQPQFYDIIKSKPGWPKGNGVVVGVIDWGIDFAHPNFRNNDGSTRFIAIWDQSQFETNSSYGYGKIFYEDEINKALKTQKPYLTLNYHPGKSDPGIGSHGTHVTDIAAGNGSIGRSGVAPEADLIFVHLAAKTNYGVNLGDSVRVLEAIDFISKIAGEKPAVINTSIGTHGGNHRGTSLVEQGIDAFLSLNHNRALCQSTGNYHLAKAHASGIIRPGRQDTLEFIIDKADITPNEIEIWYAGKDIVSLTLRHKEHVDSIVSKLDQNNAVKIKGTTCGMIYHRSNEPNSGLNHIDIFLNKNAPPGIWELKLYGDKIVDGRYNAWIERDNGCKKCQAVFDQKHVNTFTTIGVICNGFNTITVGAYDNHQKTFTIAPFSSKGPTADGRVKPDLVAPGVKILAARSTPLKFDSPMGLLTRMSGTSMATPHVTGAVALLFEAINKPVAIHNIRNILLASTDMQKVTYDDKWRLGSGSLNIERALEMVKKYNKRNSVEENMPDRSISEQVLIPLDRNRSVTSTEKLPKTDRPHDFASNTKYSDVALNPLNNVLMLKNNRVRETNELLKKILAPYPEAFIGPNLMMKSFLNNNSRLGKYLREHFEVIAYPNERFKKQVKAGDILLKKNEDKTRLMIFDNTNTGGSSNYSDSRLFLRGYQFFFNGEKKREKDSKLSSPKYFFPKHTIAGFQEIYVRTKK